MTARQASARGAVGHRTGRNVYTIVARLVPQTAAGRFTEPIVPISTIGLISTLLGVLPAFDRH
jgi:hypothetical protein